MKLTVGERIKPCCDGQFDVLEHLVGSSDRSQHDGQMMARVGNVVDRYEDKMRVSMLSKLAGAFHTRSSCRSSQK
jgi:hypothetical protein